MAGTKDLDGAITQVQEAIDSNLGRRSRTRILVGFRWRRGDRAPPPKLRF
jgi:hypothetical protein